MRNALDRNTIPRMSSEYAEDLADTEGKVGAVRRLAFFDEFDQKPKPEGGDEEEAEQKTAWRSGFELDVESIQPHEDRSVGDRLVELCGMSLCIVDLVENDGPGDIGGDSENLRVEEITESDQQSGEGDDNDHPIEQPQIRLIGVASGVDEQRCQNADRATVAGEPAFPHHEHLVRIAEVVSRVVEEAMPQACARDRADHHVRQERCEIGFRLPLSLEERNG